MYNPQISHRDNQRLILNFKGTTKHCRPSNNSSASQPIILIGQEIEVISTDFVPIYYLPWHSQSFTGNQRVWIFLEAVIDGSNIEIQLFNQTNNTESASLQISSSGFYEMEFMSPDTDSRLVLSVRKNNGSDNSRIYGIGMRF